MFNARRILVACALAALTACGEDVAGPETIDGRYTLRQLNGVPLPYDHEGLGCCTYLNGTMDLDGGGYEVSLTARNRNNGLVFTVMEWGTYARPASSRITFARDSFAIQPFLFDVAMVSDDSLRVAFGGEGPGSPDQFQALFVRGP